MIARFLSRLAVIPAALAALFFLSILWGNGAFGEDAGALFAVLAGALLALAWVFKPRAP